MKYEKTLKSLCRQPKLSSDQIRKMFKNRSSIDVDVKSKYIGRDGFEIFTDEGLCFVTERPISSLNKKWGRVTVLQESMVGLSIPVPLYIGEGTIIGDIHRINNSENPEVEANKWLHDIFTAEIAAAYFNNYLSNSDSLKEYKSIIFEAIEAYYFGMDRIAIMSLIPVFEAGLRNILSIVLNKGSGNVRSAEFEKSIKELVISWGRNRFDEYVWYPGKEYNSDVEIDFLTHVNSQCDVINAFRIFFKNVLYKDSRKVEKGKGFNRHLILHLLNNNFDEPANFVRIFLALTHITFVESLHNEKVPFFWPGISEKDKMLGNYMRALTTEFSLPRREMLTAYGIINHK